MTSFDDLNAPSGSRQRMATLRRVLSLPDEIFIFYAFGAPQDSAPAAAGPRSKVLLHDPPLSDWWQDYRRDTDRHREDPVRQRLHRAMAPVAWNELVPAGQIDRADDDIWSPVRNRGVRAGLSIPLRDPQRGLYGSLAFIAFCKPELFDEWWRDMSHDAVGAAHLFHQGLVGDDEGAAPVRLSPREQQCLGRVARGMTSKEIARDLGLSPRTVDLHVARASTRLGAANRIEAVTLAIRAGQMDLQR